MTQLSKRTLVAMCTAIERAAGDEPVAAVALFQQRDYFLARASRWRALAGNASPGSIDIGFVGAQPDEVPDDVRAVSYGSDDPLATRWTLLLGTSHFVAAVDAVDLSAVDGDDGPLEERRLFDATWSLDSAEVDAIAAQVGQAIGPSVALDRFRDLAQAMPEGRRGPMAAALQPVLAQLTRLDLDRTELRRARDRWQLRAERDELTGAYNRAGLERLLDGPYAGRTHGLFFVDLDRFKTINDTHGHEAGDRVLVAVVNALREHLRLTDLVARFGGDEFLVVVDDAPLADLASSAERLRKVIHALAIRDAPEIRVHASIGVVGGWGEPFDLSAADAAMYEAKRAGGNAVVAQ